MNFKEGFFLFKIISRQGYDNVLFILCEEIIRLINDRQ